jgi:hypothetical protein
MTNVKLIKLKIKEGKQELWRNWSQELMRRRDEVLKTLEQEGVVSESCFISEDGAYVYYYMEAKDLGAASQIAQENAMPIDIEHRKTRDESLEPLAKLECLFHFSNLK